ncbi:V-type ATPase subunit [Methanoregula sp.]|uniref:V-type ATPase subunit n=1 Tax=Methanoregula sp. TaxID=2052170 RepID=UPI002B51A969|nr:V-type ATPase subunit [Methanoregula sp.]HVP96446.1 V-type ATPase subunit [Methanoregula sp.]
MDWGYINARMRGMKSRLLDHRTLDTLILQPDLGSLMSELEKTTYRDDLIEAKGRYTGMPCIEYALRQNFVRTFRKILSFAKKEEAEVYIRIFLHRWDVQNIKTILRGKNIHVTSEEILGCLVPAGELDETTLTELVRQQDTKAVIDLLATWRLPWAKPLTTAFLAFAKSGDISGLECALDRYYYEDTLHSVLGPDPNKAMIRQILATEIDVINIKTVLRMIRDHIDPAEGDRFLIEGGLEFDLKTLRRLLALPTIGDALNGMATPRYRFLSSIPESVITAQKISVIEKDLERYLISRGTRFFSGDPLSVSSLIGYFWAKYNEITNIRIIARCKTADFPVEHLREELVYV